MKYLSQPMSMFLAKIKSKAIFLFEFSYGNQVSVFVGQNFLSFVLLLVILLFEMADSVVLNCYLIFLNARKL
jgi:hypothetical protein